MTYSPLPTSHLDQSASLLRPVCALPDRVQLAHSALDVMTDFRRMTAFIASPDDTLQQVEARMIRRTIPRNAQGAACKNRTRVPSP